MTWIVGFFAGIFTAMGLGGGCVFLVAQLLVHDVAQLVAAGMNLLFFIPIGIVSLFFHQKNKLIKWKNALPAIFGGVLGGAAGALLSPLLPEFVLRYAFAGLLVVMGIKQIK